MFSLFHLHFQYFSEYIQSLESLLQSVPYYVFVLDCILLCVFVAPVLLKLARYIQVTKRGFTVFRQETGAETLYLQSSLYVLIFSGFLYVVDILSWILLISWSMKLSCTVCFEKVYIGFPSYMISFSSLTLLKCLYQFPLCVNKNQSQLFFTSKFWFIFPVLWLGSIHGYHLCWLLVAPRLWCLIPQQYVYL